MVAPTHPKLFFSWFCLFILIFVYKYFFLNRTLWDVYIEFLILCKCHIWTCFCLYLIIKLNLNKIKINNKGVHVHIQGNKSTIQDDTSLSAAGRCNVYMLEELTEFSWHVNIPQYETTIQARSSCEGFISVQALGEMICSFQETATGGGYY